MIDQVLLEYGTVGAFTTDDIFDLGGQCKEDEVHTLEAQVNTNEGTLTFIGDHFPNLRKLRLNNSVIQSIRDIGCSFVHLRFLSLARCGITSLCGITTLSSTIEELYLAFNNITDVSDLVGMDSLKVLDLEDNLISDLSNIEFLTCCTNLKSLTLAGNPCVEDPEAYRKQVAKLVPKLMYLDEKRLRPKSTKKKALEFMHPETISNERVYQIREPSTSILVNECKDNNKVNSKKEELPIKEPPLPIREPQPKVHEPTKSSPSRPVKEPRVKIIEPPMDIVEEEYDPYMNDDEIIITEMLNDMIDDRPPTSRGNYEKQFFKDKMEVPQRNRTSKGFKNKPHVITPRVRRVGRCVSAAKSAQKS